MNVLRKPLIVAIGVTGFGGIVAQILLLRELLVTFYGNELSIGIILANWLILEAFGCFFLGKRIERLKKKVEAFVTLQLIFSLSLPIAIYLTRILKELMGVTLGEGLGLWPILYGSFLVLLPVSLPHGALFTFACKLYSSLSSARGKSLSVRQAGGSGEDASSIGKVYIYETLGTIAGGVAFTYLLIPYFHSLQIALAVALLSLIPCLFLLIPLWRKRQVATNLLSVLSILLLLLSASLLFSPAAETIHRLSLRRQWRGQELLHYQNSIYGNVAVTRRAEQYTFFSDGIPIITTPVPDITFAEEFVHLPLLSHPQPKEVLVIGGGAGGVINEILKHPVDRVDYVELDPLLLKVVEGFPTPLTQAELSNPKVKIKYIDGRLFVKKTSHKYDLLLVGLSEPSDLQVNRFFTQEFFSLVKERLKKKGILVIGLPGSLAYLSEELKNLNGCILSTLKSTYPYVRVIPGDSTNLYLASTFPGVSLINPALLNLRLKKRALKLSLLTSGHIEYRLHPRWRDWFLKSLKGSSERLNRDFQPLGVFYSISYWNALFSPYLRGLFRRLERVNLSLFIYLLSLSTLLFLLLRIRFKKLVRMSIPLCIATTGFAGMIFDLGLIFAFQILYGYVYHWIGLLITAFMVGVAVGSLRMTSFLERIERDFISFIRLELAIILFSGILPLIFLKFSPYLIVFLILSFISGLLVGAEFPLANKLQLHPHPSLPHQGGGSKPFSSSPLEGVHPPDYRRGEGRSTLSGTAGTLYASDLLGGWIGGILGGVVLLSVLGLFGTCMVVVTLKASSLLILITSPEKG